MESVSLKEAKAAIDRLFSDVSVSRATTLAELQDVVVHTLGCIDAVKGDIEHELGTVYDQID